MQETEISQWPLQLVKGDPKTSMSFVDCLCYCTNPKYQVLQLPSLEILDLSRNRIRSLPDDIRHMTSLKVLALQRNLIERLPTCLGEMATLRVLKVNENPLTFPPQNLCAPDDEPGVSVAGDKAMIAVTQRIKRYLRDYAGSTPKARTVFVESDGELSESNAETPRPFRPMGTRFPVRPSLSGTDSMISPSASPEPPPIPSKSHERMRSNQLPVSRKNTLLSPPESNMTLVGSSFGEPGSDVTVRPKRHGMITPRGPEGAAQQMALSPSALQEAFSNIESRPPSRAGSSRSTSSLTTENIVDTAKIVYNTAGDLYRRLYTLRSLMEPQNQPSYKAKLEVELQAASLRADALQKAVSRSPNNNSANIPHRHVLKPLVECLVSISSLSRLLVHVTPLYCRTSSQESFRRTFWNTQQDIWELHVANFRMSDVLASVNHSRQTSTSSQYLGPTNSRFDNGGYVPSRSGMIPSPTGSIFSSSNYQNGSNNFSSALSPIPAPLNIQPRPTVSFEADSSYGMREDEMRQEVANDALWEDICRVLHTMCEIILENLSKIQAFYRSERQRALRQYEQDQDFIKQLGSLVNRCNVMLDTLNTLARRLENLTPNDRMVRHSLEFWTFPRTVFLVSFDRISNHESIANIRNQEWMGLAQLFKQLPRGACPSDIKNLMKPIHNAIKGASGAVSNSPWVSYMQKSNYNLVHGIDENSQTQGSSGAPTLITINTHRPNNDSVPSTPLSAALGPAAAAALPSKGSSRPTINFFERADRYATASNQRQPDVIYSKRGA